MPASLRAWSCGSAALLSYHIRSCPPPHRTGMWYSRNRGFTETSDRQKPSGLSIKHYWHFWIFLRKNRNVTWNWLLRFMFMSKRHKSDKVNVIPSIKTKLNSLIINHINCNIPFNYKQEALIQRKWVLTLNPSPCASVLMWLWMLLGGLNTAHLTITTVHRWRFHEIIFLK